LTKVGVYEHNGEIYASGWPADFLGKYNPAQNKWTVIMKLEHPYQTVMFPNPEGSQIYMIRTDAARTRLFTHHLGSETVEEYSCDVSEHIIWSCCPPVMTDTAAYFYMWFYGQKWVKYEFATN
jgi:hypothetical protein